MHWAYKFNSDSDLEQGDILQPSDYRHKGFGRVSSLLLAAPRQ
jgi:hypothetical protein